MWRGAQPAPDPGRVAAFMRPIRVDDTGAHLCIARRTRRPPTGLWLRKELFRADYIEFKKNTAQFVALLALSNLHCQAQVARLHGAGACAGGVVPKNRSIGTPAHDAYGH